jgi:hypothetical protein
MERERPKEARHLSNRCSKCLYCPACFNKAIINRTMMNDEKIYYYMCQGCRWNSISIGITSKNMVDIYTSHLLSSKQKGVERNRVFEALLTQFRNTQELIKDREKKEIRQKNKTNLVEEFKGSGTKERIKYTHDMFNTDQEIKMKDRHAEMNILGDGVTQKIIMGTLEIKEISHESAKKEFKDYLGNCVTKL